MDPTELQALIENVHGRFAQELEDLVGVALPARTLNLMTSFFDEASTKGHFEPQIPSWALRLYDVQEGLTAAYYHQRNLAQLGAEIATLLERSFPDPVPGLPEANMGISARAFTFEYQAYLLSVRRAFEYLGNSLLDWFVVRPPNSVVNLRDIPQLVAKARAPRDVAGKRACQLLRRCPAEFPDILQADSARNRLAHLETVHGGAFNLMFRPGLQMQLRLVGGAASGLDHIFTVEELVCTLDAELRRFERLLSDLLPLIDLSLRSYTPLAPATRLGPPPLRSHEELSGNGGRRTFAAVGRPRIVSVTAERFVPTPAGHRP